MSNDKNEGGQDDMNMNNTQPSPTTKHVIVAPSQGG